MGFMIVVGIILVATVVAAIREKKSRHQKAQFFVFSFYSLTVFLLLLSLEFLLPRKWIYSLSPEVANGIVFISFAVFIGFSHEKVTSLIHKKINPQDPFDESMTPP